MATSEKTLADAEADSPRPKWRPRHLFLNLGEGLLRRCAKLPLARQLAIGRGLSPALWALAGAQLNIARINLRICFPGITAEEREALLKRHVKALGMGFFETGAAWFSDDNLLRQKYVLEGRRHLDAALARGRGVLLLGAHFTAQELGVRLLNFHYDLHGVYRRHPDSVQEQRVRAARLKHYADLIPSDDMRRALKYLQKGKIVWYPPDQDFGAYGRRHNAFVPFFGVDAATVTVPGRLACKTGAALVPFFFRRGIDGVYRLSLLPPLDEAAGDPVAVARTFNGLLERAIVKAPEQYMWVHERFKTRPNASDPPPYL